MNNQGQPQTPNDLINTFSQPLQPPDPTQPQGLSGNPVLNNILQWGLPTAGAVLGAAIPGFGETGISEAGGAAGGQYLADLLTGKNPGADVGLSAAGGALGPVLGKILGGVGGKALGISDQLLGKPTSDIFNSVVQKDPFMIQNTAKLTSAAKDLGYMDQPIGQSLAQMPKDFSAINDQITQAVSENNTAIPLTTGKNNLLDNFTNQLDKSAYGPGDAGYDSSVNSILNKITSLGDGSTDAQTIYQEKQAMGNILSNTFDRQAKGATLLPKEEANLAYFNALKDSLDQFGSPEVRALNSKQNQLYDIAKAFGTQYAKTAGKNAPALTFNDMAGGFGGAELFHMLGLNPLGGAATGLALDKAVQSPLLMKILGSTLQGGAKISSSPLGIGAGVVGAQALNNNLFPQVGQPTQGSPNTSSDNSRNQSQVNSSPLIPGSISQSAQNSNPNGQIQAFDGKTTFPSQLPDVSQISNTIPNQPYPQEQYQADIQKWTALAQANPYNQGIQTQAQAGIAQANDLKSENDSYVNTYLQQNGLSSTQVQFVRSLPPLWSSMNDLRQLISTQGGRSLFQSVVNDNPAIQYIKARTDQTGQYGRMLQLMQTISEETARVNQGGPPSNFQTALNQAFSPGNNLQTNLANLDQAQEQMLNQYEQYLPLYGLSLSASGSKAPQSGHDVLMNMIHQTGQ